MPVLKFRKHNRYYHLYRQNNLFDGITLICCWGAFDSHRGGHKFILCKNNLDFNINLGKITKVRFARGYMVNSLLIKPPIVSLIKQYCFSMDNKDFTIPKNLLLNWLYSSDRHVPLEELGKWIRINTGGRYQLVDTGVQTRCV